MRLPRASDEFIWGKHVETQVLAAGSSDSYVSVRCGHSAQPYTLK
jgi:hypothetical protein